MSEAIEQAAEQEHITPGGDWVCLRDKWGRVQATYNPLLRLLLIKERRTTTPHDLRKYDELTERAGRA
jgi:hypothetical protein